MKATKSDPKVVGVLFSIAHETEKAYLVATQEGNLWMPKRSCHGLWNGDGITFISYVDMWIIAKSNLWRLTDKKVRNLSTILSR